MCPLFRGFVTLKFEERGSEIACGYLLTKVKRREGEGELYLHEGVGIFEEPANDGVAGLVVGNDFLLLWL